MAVNANWTKLVLEISELLQRITTPYIQVKEYLEDLRKRAEVSINAQSTPLERKLAEDAKKLIDMIAMAVYYSANGQGELAPSPYTLERNPEVLNILFLELLDQVESPSCDQGPYIRLLMAFEPLAEYKFPYLTRNSIQFYIKEDINNYYEQLTLDEKRKLIESIYEKVEDKSEIYTIPKDSLSFLAQQFIDEYKVRIGSISIKEIEDSFFMERFDIHHPQMIIALQNHHQELKESMRSTSSNPHRFSMRASTDMEVIENKDENDSSMEYQ